MSIITILIAGIMSVTGIWSRWDRNDGNWDDLAPLLAANGYDTVFYMAAYGTVIDGEGLQECLNACLPMGIDVHAWVVMWRTDYAPDVQQGSMLREGRMQAYSDGEVIHNWMNPTDPRNVELMARICLRIAAEYPVTGIHLDYIRYKSYLSGYSESTRDRFLDEMSLRSLNWPDDCIRDGQYYDSFMEWRAGKMTDAVRAVRDSLNRINRVVHLSAAVMPHEREMLLFGQMWNRWLEQGLIDFAVTMNYTESDSQYVIWCEDQVEMAGDNTILCGIGELSASSALSERETLHQIALAENMGFDGFVIYHLCDEVIEKLESSRDSDPGNRSSRN
jgi:uncharacterized lipoprotein YddW (UPF0748 family)